MDFTDDMSLEERETAEQENMMGVTEENQGIAKEERIEGSSQTNESKADKFHRLAAPRVDKAGHAIELIGNLSGSAYEYTPEEVEKMFGYLQQVLDDTKAKFTKTAASKDKFTF